MRQQSSPGQWNDRPGLPEQRQRPGPPGGGYGNGQGSYGRPPPQGGGAWDWPAWLQTSWPPNGNQQRGQDPNALAGAAPRGASFSLGTLFGGGPSSLWGSYQEEPLSVESLLHLPGNEECADCSAPRPEWASVNQGSVLCIDCAGVHRSLGAHISKVKSLRLDAWKPEEMRAFRAQGGNTQVNKRLAPRGGLPSSTRNPGYQYLVRPDGSGGKPDISDYIRKKYHATGPAEYGGDSRTIPAAPTPSSDSAAGRNCFQGVCFVEIMGVEISPERSRDLRMMGPLFLSLSVTMSLGSISAEPSASKRGSSVCVWEPPERREILWDCKERWLWCRVYDGAELIGLGSLAAEARIDLRLLDDASNVEVALDLYAYGGEDSDDESATSRRHGHGFGAPAGYFQDGRGMPQDPTDPSVTGQLCGVARLRLTLVDMSTMDSGKKPKGRAGQGQGYSQGQSYGQHQTRQNEGSVLDYMPSGLSALLGSSPAGQSNGTGRPWT